MFFLYEFNQLNILFLKICKIIKKNPLPYIFEKEIIIHDNEVLLQYLNIFTANYTGISSDFKLIHPDVYIFKIFEKIIPKSSIKNILQQTTNIWQIMKIIEEKNFFEKINKNDKKIKKFEFSLFIENLFQQYILYRPKWIQEWTQSTKKISTLYSEKSWQIKLWHAIIYDKKNLNQNINNFSSLFDKFNNLIKKKHSTSKTNFYYLVNCYKSVIYRNISKNKYIY